MKTTTAHMHDHAQVGLNIEVINHYNNRYFDDVMRNEELDTVCYQLYEEHKKSTDVDFWHVENITPDFPELDAIKKEDIDAKREFFPAQNGEYARKVIPNVTSLMLIKEMDRKGKLTNKVKKIFNYDELVLNLHIQEPGTMISIHVDYNRSLFRNYPEKSKTLLIKNMKRYVWFLQDQQLGQMFNVGRQFVTWKRGDVVQWPWYMPHATANASEHDRHMLTLIGF